MTRLTVDERKSNMDLLKKKEMELEEAIGFRKVIDAIVESKKPVIGHNCFLGTVKLSFLSELLIIPVSNSLSQIWFKHLINFLAVCPKGFKTLKNQFIRDFQCKKNGLL